MTDSFHKGLLTGGLDYFGSHNCLELLHDGVGVTAFDNFCKSLLLALVQVAQNTGKKPRLAQGEIIHFCGVKKVGEPVQKPLADYENNVAGWLNLLQVF